MFTKADIEKYFNAEKNGSLLLIIIGLLAVILALSFIFYFKTNWHKGFAVSLMLMGLIHFAVGYTVYNKCDENRKRNVYAYDMNPAELKISELPRMKKITSNLVVYKSVEVIIFLLGIAIFFYFRNAANKSFFTGLGLALAIEAIISFGFSFTAAQRAKQYINELDNFIRSVK